MKNNTTFTSSINNSLIKKLNDCSDRYKVPKNRIIENALIKYFDELKRIEYVQSFRRAQNDPEMLEMAEEGMEDYIKIIERYE
jgi:hypothetical protein